MTSNFAARVCVVPCGVLDMTLWLSCHRPSLLAKQPRQTQQHLFPVASGSTLACTCLLRSSNVQAVAIRFFEDSEPVIVRAEQNTSDQKHPMLDAGTRARVANFVGCGAKFGRKSAQKSPARLPSSTQ